MSFAFKIHKGKNEIDVFCNDPRSKIVLCQRTLCILLMLRMQAMFIRIPRNVAILTLRGMLKIILGNVQEDSREYLKAFLEMLLTIPGMLRGLV